MAFLLITGLLVLFAIRLFYVLFHLQEKPSKSLKTRSVLAVAGSGGHTTEIVRLLSSLPSTFRPHSYVVATSDKMSVKKIESFESTEGSENKFTLYKIPRSREVSQSWGSTIITTFHACLASFPIMWKSRPDILLCNGPGTCIPLCIVALIYKVLGICATDIVFVESMCRVTTMSLSGKILYPFANRFYVQWPQLLQQYPHAIYLGGRLV
uniref:UDP-N-acetylglucosamine transferase subunit ALG14 n=1 Tax=Phallusia mammillata TaxID=59560 RepID=A0A6F9D5I5_9ASCI|nr:UDP-N-acetylglucosamine transferase subunit ALG14 homolog [Phallusia mammillata]